MQMIASLLPLQNSYQGLLAATGDLLRNLSLQTFSVVHRIGVAVPSQRSTLIRKEI
jgi:hypothetical protein